MMRSVGDGAGVDGLVAVVAKEFPALFALGWYTERDRRTPIWSTCLFWPYCFTANNTNCVQRYIVLKEQPNGTGNS